MIAADAARTRESDGRDGVHGARHRARPDRRGQRVETKAVAAHHETSGHLFAEALYGRLKVPFVVVFDGYHDVAALLPVLHYLGATGATNAAAFVAERNQIVRDFLSNATS